MGGDAPLRRPADAQTEAAEIGCQTLGGLDMLVNQGILAFEWWTNQNPNRDLMKRKIIEFLGIK